MWTAALAGMAREQRRALLLRHGSELPWRQLVQVLHASEAGARRLLIEAAQELRRRLEEVGRRFKPGEV
jgi:DNA-directed RNA polymerase specialized sigma24 family protein